MTMQLFSFEFFLPQTPERVEELAVWLKGSTPKEGS